MSGEIKTTEPLMMDKLKKNWMEMSVKQKRRTVFKILLFLVCGSLLVYHGWQLFDQYNSGKTLVTIKYTRLKRESVPAFTVCLPMALRMDRLADRFPELQENYTRYRKLMDTVDDSDYDNQTLKDSLAEMYNQFVDYYTDKRLPLNDIYSSDSNLTVPQLITNSSDTNRTIGGQYIISMINIYNNKKLTHVSDYQPIVSLMNLVYPTKCLTFFSELNHRYRQYKHNLDSIFFMIGHNKHWFPASMYDNWPLFLIMHSSNNTPYDTYTENVFSLHMNNYYWIGYSTIKTIRLPPNWDTKCREYNIYDYNNSGTGSSGHPRTRFECRYRCFQRLIQQKNRCCVNNTVDNNNTIIDCNQCIPWDVSLIPDYLTVDNVSTCYKYVDYGSCELPFRDSCDEQCPDSCYENHYLMSLINKQKVQFIASKSNRWDNATVSAYIRHSAHLDQLVEHSPEMTRIEFLSNLGGLLGMWLGLAVFSLLDLIVKIF
ncbi:uncharacterized protein LOC128957999 [Oppia nitens]|uniref:uncharacterized protein LOC128957999 n=1 Tax=Oppia nitens TaxID=1686743 RepID=UPI0023DC69EE|nr:uncharacterized protein LOC128957999 [Oppia nitens]